MIYEVLARMGLGAAVPGEADLALGPERLRDLAATEGVLLLAANLSGPDGELLFAPSTRVAVGGLWVGVVGLFSPSLCPPGLRASDPAAALREQVAALAPVDLVVGLVHEPEAEDGPLARAAPGLDVLIAAHGGVPQAPRRLPGGAVVVRTGAKNHFLGRLDLEVAPGRPTLDPEARAAWIDREEAQAVGSRPAAARPSALAHGGYFASSLVPLGADLPADAQIVRLLRAYRTAADAREVARLTPGAAASAATSGYAGATACAGCHAAAEAVWRASGHARAYETLGRVGEALDPSCVGCHTTGYGEAGGFARPAEVGFLREVQCEACHGPGKAHLADSRAPYPARANGEALCQRCHNPDRSPGFAYGTYLDRIRH